jgi:hypothetical protein
MGMEGGETVQAQGLWGGCKVLVLRRRGRAVEVVSTVWGPIRKELGGRDGADV